MTAKTPLRAVTAIALALVPLTASMAQPATDPVANVPSTVDAPPAPAPAPDAPGLPTDAISSAANPPDEAPSPDAAAPAAPPIDIAPAPPPATPAPDINVLDSQLLSIQTDSTGAETATPATSIPYVVGKSCYSWALKYQPVEGDLVLTEELDLPGPARNWNIGGGEKSEVNSQSSGATTERHFDASTGTASAGWCVAKDDPVGSYRYIIRQGEREVARFDFTVGDLL